MVFLSGAGIRHHRLAATWYSLESTCRFLSLCVHVYTQIDNASKDLRLMLETLGHLEKKFIEMVLDNKPS